MPGRSVFWRLVEECLRWRGRLAVLVASLVAMAAARLYLTWLVKRWSDALLGPGEADLGGVLALASFVTAFIVVCVFVSQYLMSGINFRLVEALRGRAQARLMSLGAAALRRRHSGDLLSRVFNDAAALQGFARDVLKRLLGEGIVLAGSIAMMFYLDWRLAFAAAVMVPMVALILAPLGRSIRRAGARAQGALGDLTVLLEEQLRGFTTIKGYQTEDAERRRFADRNADYRSRALSGELWSSLLLAGVWMITGVGLLAILWFGGREVALGVLTPGGLLAFCLYAVQTIEPLRHLGEVHTILQRGLAAADRLYEIIDDVEVEEPALPERENPPSVLRAGGAEIAFERVSFAYGDRSVLDGFDLRVGAGETVALVAASGAGKSTVAGLLVRHLAPESGRISLDGVDLRTLPLADLRRIVCVVEQEPFLFSDTLRANVRYGTPSASLDDVDEALRLAGLDGFVRSLPQGLDESIVQAGRNLSGGQKQRIALARAIVRDPVVLVLDEATSALDSDVEGRIFAGLEGWLERRTTIVMAHRLSTVSRFDRVVVLHDGRVAGDGPIEFLIRSCPAFNVLFAEQLAVAGPGDRIEGRRRRLFG